MYRVWHESILGKEYLGEVATLEEAKERATKFDPDLSWVSWAVDANGAIVAAWTTVCDMPGYYRIVSVDPAYIWPERAGMSSAS